MFNTKLASLAMGLFFFTASCFAEPYVGAWIGVVDPDSKDFSSGPMLKLTLGYEFFDYVAIEASLTDIGKLDSDTDSSVKFDGFETSVIGFLPLAENLDALMRVGLYDWDADIEGNDIFDLPGGGTDLVFGLGISYTFEDQGNVKLEYNQYNLEGGQVNGISLGLEAHFF